MNLHLDHCPRCRATADGLIGASLPAGSTPTVIVEGPPDCVSAGLTAGGDRLADPPEPDELVEFSPSDRFMVSAKLASGGMGIVYRGFDRELKREVAIKVPRGNYESANTQRLYREADISGQLQHPGVVPVYHRGRLVDGRPYVVMKLINGQTLLELIHQPDREEREHDLLHIFYRVCQAMAYAHANGIVHRDLKPANVMVGEFGEVQVIDWGLAKKIGSAEEPRSLIDLNEPSEVLDNQCRDDDQVSAGDTHCSHTLDRSMGHTAGVVLGGTRAGAVMGSVGYMAPEQTTGRLTGKYTDVFALGGILYQILTGHTPFGHRSSQQRPATRPEQQIGERLPQPLLERLAQLDVDPRLRAIASMCLASDPVARPRDAQAVCSRLEKFLRKHDRQLV